MLFSHGPPAIYRIELHRPPNHGSFSLTFYAHADVTSAAISNAIFVLMTILKPEYPISSHRTTSIAIHSLPENCCPFPQVTLATRRSSSKPGCSMFVNFWHWTWPTAGMCGSIPTKWRCSRQGSRWREAAAALQRRPRGRSPRAVGSGSAIEFDPNGGLEVLVLEVASAKEGRLTGRSHGCGCPSARTSARAQRPTAAACGSKRATSVTSKQRAPRVKGESSSVSASIEEGSTIDGSGLADCGGPRSRPARHQRTNEDK